MKAFPFVVLPDGLLPLAKVEVPPVGHVLSCGTLKELLKYPERRAQRTCAAGERSVSSAWSWHTGDFARWGNSTTLADMLSKATTVGEYLAGLPPERRKELATVRAAVKRALPKGYTEMLQNGMISYVVPLKLFPEGYLGKKDVPLPCVSLAAHNTFCALYLMNVYGSPELEHWFRAAYAQSGKKLDMGKSCVRFKSAADLALDVVCEAITRTPASDFIARYIAARAGTRTATRSPRPTPKASTKKRK